MNRKAAAVRLVVICAVIVLLLVTGKIPFAIAAAVFAIALVLLGVASRGFTRR